MIRFSNEEVNKSIENVIKKISDTLSAIENDFLEPSESDSPFLDREARVELHDFPKSLESNSPLPGRGVEREVKTAKRETSTMPGYAGSSWYFLRYMDPGNETTFCDRNASDYWQQVDVYVGGTEHAVGHLLYSRMWTKFLFDRGWIGFDEPFKKLVNQGMITGKSYFFRLQNLNHEGQLTITSFDKKELEKMQDESDVLLTRFKYGHQFVNANGRLSKANFDISSSGIKNKILWEKDKDGEFILLKEESEKMSKSKFNVDNPDDLVAKYGADTFRMYEMFLGPVEQSKPWDTKGIEGVHRFLRKLWRLFFDEVKGKLWTEDEPTDAEYKILYRTIKKVNQDTENFSFNTAVSAFMVCVNELAEAKCSKKKILEKLLVILVPYAPHISEELWHQLGNQETILDASYPEVEEKYLVENNKEYPVSINGKLRTTINIALDIDQPEVEKIVLDNEVIKKWLEGKPPKKIIFVKGKMVNIVAG